MQFELTVVNKPDPFYVEKSEY